VGQRQAHRTWRDADSVLRRVTGVGGCVGVWVMGISAGCRHDLHALCRSMRLL
jgi:hypothetical protein